MDTRRIDSPSERSRRRAAGTTARHRAPAEEKPPRLGWKPRDLVTFGKILFARWKEDKVPKLAAALAYYTTFSIAPILVIAIAVAGLVFGADAARGGIATQISGLVGEQAGETVQTLLQHAWKPRTGILATAIGVLALMFGATGVFSELQDSLNIIWRVRKKPGRGILGMLKDRFLSFGMVAGIGFLLLVSLVVSAGLQALEEAIFGSEELSVVARLLQELVSLLIISVLFSLSLKVLPDVRMRWRDAAVGGIVTGILFTAGKFLIGLYLGKSSVGSAFGAAGSLAIFLLWVYYSSQIFFLGAEFTKVFADTHGRPVPPDPDAVPLDKPPLGR